MPIPPHPRRAEAEALLRERRTDREVAETVGASVATVARWRERLELPPVRLGRGAGAAAQGVQAEVVRLLEEGRAAGVPARQLAGQVAKQVGVTPARVRQIGAELPRISVREEAGKLFKQLEGEGVPARQIVAQVARALGVTPARIRQIRAEVETDEPK